MTAEKAKTKWCPFARAPQERNGASPTANRTAEGNPDIGAKCVASACMAWRWYQADQGFCGLSGFSYASSKADGSHDSV